MENSRAKPPPGVEEALSSMLWTPYPEESSESSSDESDLESFKRRKRPLTWAVNDNHDFASTGPYSISSRLSYPSYYPPSYLPSIPSIQHAPKSLTHSFTDNFLSSYQQVEQVRLKWFLSERIMGELWVNWIDYYYLFIFPVGTVTGMFLLYFCLFLLNFSHILTFSYVCCCFHTFCIQAYTILLSDSLH